MTALPAGYRERLTTSEGVVVWVADTVPAEWTASRVADILRPNAYQLATLGSNLTIVLQTTYASVTSGGASYNQEGVYTSYQATIYLDARDGSTFLSRPDFTIAHEYGHFWSNYWMFLKHGGSFNDYLVTRGVANDPRLGSDFGWMVGEMIGDDYRFLFGTQTAIDQMGHVNRDIPDPRTVPGLADWFVSSWA